MDFECSDKDLDGYLDARRFAKVLSREIISKIEVGMSEEDIEGIASEVFRAYDVRQHWHMPIIGVGEGSTKLSSIYALTSGFLTKHKRILQLEAFVSYVRDVSRKIAEYASNKMIVTDVFRYAQELIRTTSNYTLLYPPLISLGHRLSRVHPLEKLPEPGLSYLILKEFPFINSSNLTPMDGLWVVEPYLMHNKRAAKFEELVCVGRESVIPDRD